MCKNYLYCRISTDNKGQEFRRQMLIAENSGLEFEQVFQEQISGGVRGDQREEFNKMLKLLDKDSCVVVSESSRFGRNYIDCLEMIDIITIEKGANIKFLSNGLELKGGEKPSPYEWLVLSQFFIMDEFQKRQIGYNTKMALQAKKKAGIKLGAPRNYSDSFRSSVVEFYKDGHTMAETGEKFGISSATVYRFVKEAK